MNLVIVHSAVRGVSAQTLERFAARAQRAAGLRGQIDILITSNTTMRRLNRRFRGKNAATDVLSFPSVDGSAGDIAISTQIAARNARRLGHSPTAELKILILHGLLHLAGYDHVQDAGEMARKEAHLRRALGLPMTLIERAADNGRQKGDRRGARKGRRS